MKKFSFLTFITMIVFILINSCNTTDKVVSEKNIQKRKYRPGFYISILSANKSDRDHKKEELKYNKNSKSVSDAEIKTKAVTIPDILLVTSEKEIPYSAITNKTAAAEVKELFNKDYQDSRAFKSEYLSVKNKIKLCIIPDLKKEQKKDGKEAKNAPMAGGGGASITSFVLGIVGLFVAGIILGSLAIVFGIIGLLKRRFIGLAITGIILGMIDIIGALIFISLMAL